MPSYFSPRSIFSTLFSGTANQVVSNTTSEMSLMPTGMGQKIIPANTLVQGTTARLIIAGVYSGALVPTTALFKFKINGNVVASGTASALLASASNQGFSYRQTMTCRAAGTTGSLVTVGTMQYANGLMTRANVDLNNIAGYTIDTTVDNTLDLSVTWGALSSSNSMTAVTATLEYLQV